VTSLPARSVDLDARTLWHAARAPLAVVLVVTVAAIGLVLARSGEQSGYLDPGAPSDGGSLAVTQLLRHHGVTVRTVRTTDAAVRASDPESTLLVAVPDLLTRAQLARLAATDASMVLVQPGQPALDALAPGVRAVGSGEVREHEPACDLPAAERAGPADTGGSLFTAGSAAGDAVTLCYPVGGSASLLQVSRSGRLRTVLGSGELLTNDRLATAGNASLALSLLGRQSTVVWYLPDPADVAAGPQDDSLISLLPAGWRWAAGQLFVGVLLLAAWRARRLGPVVAEPLPVAVRASETVEGRARLYQRARAHKRAADELRAASLRAMAPIVGAGSSARTTPQHVVAAVAARTGRPEAEVGSLLYGPPPVDDAALVRLADDLDTLDRQVRRP
jgi:uncharacterized protein DUF4350